MKIDVNVRFIQDSLRTLNDAYECVSDDKVSVVEWNKVYTDINNFESLWYIMDRNCDKEEIRRDYSATYKKINGDNTITLSKGDINKILTSISNLKEKTYKSKYIVKDDDIKSVINTIKDVTGVKNY